MSFRGSNAMQKDIGDAAKELEMNLEKMSIDDEESYEDDIPIFTAELAKMKAEALGEKFKDEGEDQEMDEDDISE